MKKIALFFFIAFPLISLGQDPPKKSTKVIVKSTDTNNKIYRDLTRLLIEDGYSFETRDSSLKVIVTNPIASRSWGTVSKLRVIFTDSTIVFTSSISLQREIEIFNEGQPSVKSFYPVNFSGAKKSAMREAWNTMVEFAKKCGPVTYE